jgi:UDP-glucuronate 4-epimerase
VTLYGVTKEANEQWARIYWQDYQIPSIGLRPFFVYGPGRDQGVSSTPTKAMVAAAAGRPYHVSFGGTALYQHADDVAAAFIQASRVMPQGCEVYNLGGTDATVEEIAGHITRIAPEMAGKITHETAPLFTPDSVDGSELEKVIGPVTWRPIEQGIRDTMDQVRTAIAAGRIDLERAIN